MSKPTIAVIFGSRSTEHDISVLTAIGSVIKPLELSRKYTVLPVYIAKDGSWYVAKEFADIKLFQGGRLEEFLAQRSPVSISLTKGLTLQETGRRRNNEYNIDVVFPALHGTHGEDGEVMAICEMANVPYVGCDVEASVIAMDKVLAKQVAVASNIPTAKSVYFSKREYESDPAGWDARVNHELRYPLFVKPAHLGSSIGISRVTDKKELVNAIEVALHYDTKALVEEGVENLIEVTLPIMGNDDIIPALLEEPMLKSEDFFDFDTKYMQGGKKGKGGDTGKQGAQGYSRIPAELPKGLYEIAESIGIEVYRALGCSGIARVDMLIDSKARKVYFNEVNPLPGSLYAHNWARAGVSNIQLVTSLIDLAEERFAKKQVITTSFSTNYLQQF
jgi:D-alanine-D-alanine ligase